MTISEFILMVSGALFWTAAVCVGVMWLIHMYLGDKDD